MKHPKDEFLREVNELRANVEAMINDKRSVASSQAVNALSMREQGAQPDRVVLAELGAMKALGAAEAGRKIASTVEYSTNVLCNLYDALLKQSVAGLFKVGDYVSAVTADVGVVYGQVEALNFNDIGIKVIGGSRHGFKVRIPLNSIRLCSKEELVTAEEILYPAKKKKVQKKTSKK